VLLAWPARAPRCGNPRLLVADGFGSSGGGSNRDDIGWYSTVRDEATMVHEALQISTFWLSNAPFRLEFVRIVALERRSRVRAPSVTLLMKPRSINDLEAATLIHHTA
jgi:hypothetical protein